jgi:thiamine-monophosphate kinase
MKLKEVGEFGLIDLIKEGAIVDNSNIIMGIGDDAAVYVPNQRHLQLLTTDMLVENIHFDLTKTSPWQLGYKAIAVNLSDIAAMGGRPRHAAVSLGLPPEVPVEFVTGLYDGMKEICKEFKVNIIGGDTVSSRLGLVINVAVVGEVEPASLLKRTGARPGDIVAVTGTLGSSACGLDLLFSQGWEDYDFAWPLVTAHLTPRPQLAIGQELAGWGATAADDISDGLASEANEVAGAGNVGLRIYAAKIPIAPGVFQAAKLLNKQPLDYALFGGEDYQLLFTMSAEAFAKLPKTKVPVSVVGEVTPKDEGVMLVKADGSHQLLPPKGYNHFR